MFVTVHLSPDVSADLAAAKPKLPATKKLLKIVSQHKLQLEFMHPGTTDAELAKHCFIRTDDETTADSLTRELTASGLVQGAYVKGKEAPPG